MLQPQLRGWNLCFLHKETRVTVVLDAPPAFTQSQVMMCCDLLGLSCHGNLVTRIGALDLAISESQVFPSL